MKFKCRIWLHNWGPWRDAPVELGLPFATQKRSCRDCEIDKYRKPMVPSASGVVTYLD